MIYLQIYLLVWFWCSFEPIKETIDSLFTKLPQNYVTNKLYILSQCMMCLNVWTVLIITQSVWMALLMGLIGQIHNKIIN